MRKKNKQNQKLVEERYNNDQNKNKQNGDQKSNRKKNETKTWFFEKTSVDV